MQLLIQLVIFIAVLAIVYLKGRHDSRHTSRNEMDALLAAVKPALHHNRSWHAFERAAEAIRIYQDANKDD